MGPFGSADEPHRHGIKGGVPPFSRKSRKENQTPPNDLFREHDIKPDSRQRTSDLSKSHYNVLCSFPLKEGEALAMSLMAKSPQALVRLAKIALRGV